MFEGPSILSLVKSGKVRALASTGPKRAQATPDLPREKRLLCGTSQSRSQHSGLNFQALPRVS